MVGVLPRAGFLRSVQRNGGGVQLTGSRVHDDSKFDRGQRETFGRRLLGPQVGDRFALRAPLGIRSAHLWRNRHRKVRPPVARTTQTLAPIVINRIPANQTDTSASLTGQLVSAGKGLVSNAPFSPSDYSGLRLWLDASDADGDGVDGSALVNGNQVSLFVDKSGQGNDAEQTIEQSQPTFIGSGLNAKPLIRFDGSDDYLQFNEINNLRPSSWWLSSRRGTMDFCWGMRIALPSIRERGRLGPILGRTPTC